MKVSRRKVIKGVAASATLASAPFIIKSTAEASNTVRVGVILDLTGPLGIFGVNKKRCLDLARDEINASGGLNGKKVEFVTYDAQANNQLYSQFADQMILKDKLDVVFGGMQSSAREIIRPKFHDAKLLYFYNMPYEGGVCDRNIFITGTTPGQLLANLIPYAIKTFGPKCYYLGVDYNFGHLSHKWATKICRENGGKVIGHEFQPVGANQFGPTIQKIQAAKPDFIITSLIASDPFYVQWAASGLKGKIGLTSQTFGEVGEHFRLPKEVGDGVVICYNYVDEIDSAANKDFLKRFRKKFGTNYGYLGDLGGDSYQGMKIYAEGVRKAGTTKREAVIEALESGIKIDGPSGQVTVDPLTHHVNFNMYLWKVQNQKLNLIEKFNNVAPTNFNGQCNLQKNPNTSTQFQAKI